MYRGGNNMKIFDIEEFNNLLANSDIACLDYLRDFISEDLQALYETTLSLNYVNDMIEQCLIENTENCNFYDIYSYYRNMLFEKIGLARIVSGNDLTYYQVKKIVSKEV